MKTKRFLAALLCALLFAGLLPLRAYADGDGLIDGIPAVNGGTVYVGGSAWSVIGESSAAWLLVAGFTKQQMQWSTADGWYCTSLYNGFSAPEQAAVKPTTKTDSDYTYTDSESGVTIHFGASTLENRTLFLLSAEEATTYFSSNEDRRDRVLSSWLRSPDLDINDYMGRIEPNTGRLDSYNMRNEITSRPAFQLDLTKVLCVSDATGAKSSAAAGGGEFGTLSAPGGNAKLTLIDSGRDGFEASVSSASVPTGGSLAVSYGGVSAGDYVSALLLNSSGTVLYHASLVPDGTGIWDLSLPGGLAAGSYTLKLFSEQQNGAYQTDYASAPISVPLTVGVPVTTYTVTVHPGANGAAGVSKEEAAEGEIITVTAQPFSGYELASITCSADGGATRTDITAEACFYMPAANVNVYVEFRPAGGGGGFGGDWGGDEWIYAAPRAYRASLAPMTGGSAYLLLSSGETGADMSVVPTSLVWVCAVPDSGYAVESIVCVPGGDITAGPCFVMPESDVTVYVTFRQAA
ncbi:MAG: hypothetical protein K6F56_05060 [Oscillospiraceae bacterium]|nr:hypothetical protein [Oscillospiraceae bacterium]